MFTVADVILVNKMDLLPYSNFDLNAYRKTVKGINDKVEVMEISCVTGQGIKRWLEWLKSQISKPSDQKI